MANEKPVESEKPAIVTMIAYCPDLDVYRYWREDGLDSMFDGVQLVAAIDSYIKQAKARDADFMARLTGFARQFPHKVVAFDGEGKMSVGNYQKPDLDGGSEKTG